MCQYWLLVFTDETLEEVLYPCEASLANSKFFSSEIFVDSKPT